MKAIIITFFMLASFISTDALGQTKVTPNTLKTKPVKKIKLTPKKNSGLKVLTPAANNKRLNHTNNVATEPRKKQNKRSKKH